MTLIDRLRTGTHEQAVGLLLECYKSIFPHYSDLPVGSEERHDAILHKGRFESLLYINTPEACVGAAMMLIPEGWVLHGISQTPDIIQEEHTGDEPLPKWDATLLRQDCAGYRNRKKFMRAFSNGDSNEPSLALAAAIMEAKNV